MTIFGEHTVAEVNELIKNTDYTISQILDAYNRNRDAWTQINKPVHDKWKYDWDTFITRYSSARTKAKTEYYALSLGNVFAPTVMRSEDHWINIKKAINVSGQGDYVTGDLPDLRNRIEIATKQNIDFSNKPGYNSTDIDMMGYNVANKTANVIKDMASNVKDATADKLTSPHVVAGLFIAGMVGVGYFVNSVRRR